MSTHTLAIGRTCEFDGCASHRDAVHHYRGRDLCAYHSPYDVRRCERSHVIIAGEPCGECPNAPYGDARLPEWVHVQSTGFAFDVVVGGVVLLTLPPRVWLRERERGMDMIRNVMRACAVSVQF